MINKNDIVRIFKYLDSPWSIPLEQRDLDAIELKLNEEVTNVEAHINDRIDVGTPPVKLEGLFKVDPGSYDSNQKAFIQTFALPVTDEIRAMVYFIAIENADIRDLKMNYTFKKAFSLKVNIELSSGKNINFNSNSIWDAEVVRHFGVMMMNNKPIFSGYFPI
jgi:hypothetical protein